jgi:hypothetical protein
VRNSRQGHRRFAVLAAFLILIGVKDFGGVFQRKNAE